MRSHGYPLAGVTALVAFLFPPVVDAHPVAPNTPPREQEDGEKSEPSKEEKEEGKKGRGRTVVRSELPVERLASLNAEELFGNGEVTINGEELGVVLDEDGSIHTTFKGKGLIDTTHDLMKGSNRRFIQYGDQSDGEKLLPGLCAVGLDRGAWISKFPLAGETKVSFKIRVPNLLTSSSAFKIRLNWDPRSRRGYEINSLNSIALVSRAQRRGGAHHTLRPEYRGHFWKWFPRRGEPIPVEVGITDGVLSVKVEGQETVSAKVKDEGGRVMFLYDNIVFTIQDLKITGELDPEWCEERFSELEKRGKLALREGEREEEPEEDTVAGGKEAEGQSGGR